MWVGDYGEFVAQSYLKSQQCVIVKTNWKHRRGGEIDIVCRHGNVLCFVEVKARTEETWGSGLRAVDVDKRHLIRAGAYLWRRSLNRPDVPYRYDVIEVLLSLGKRPEIRWVQSAFYEKDR